MVWNQLKKEETVALIDLGAEKTGIYVFKDGILQFSREVTPAGADITKAIMEGIGSEGEPEAIFERAEGIKQEMGILSEPYQERKGDKSPSLSKISFLARVTVGAAYENDSEHFSRAGNSYSVFVAGQLNLFNGLATRGKTESARSELMRAEVLKEDLKHAIALEVETAWRGLSAALDRLKVAERDTAYAAEALAIIKDRYGSGLATNLEVLDAETSDAQTQTRAIEARVGVQVAAASLALASGAMPGEGGGW